MLHEIEYPNPSGVTYFQDRDPHRMGRPGSVGIDGHAALTFGDGAFATANLTYHYDGAGNVKAIGTERYRYDKVSRVVEGVLGGGGKQSYNFDPFGNIGLITTVQGGATSHRSYAINPDTNRLNLAGYDAAGNQTGWGSGPTGFSYTWDPMSKMKVNRRGDGSVESYYLYTADDERLNTLDFSASPVEETWTIRDLDGKVLRTWENVGGFDGTWTHARDHIYRDGALLASWAPSEGIRHFHVDHLGTPRLITNANGRRVDGGTYFPFGEQADGGNPDEAMRFTGHERDLNGAGELDDLDYMHARYCNPMTGRFLSVDPALLLRRAVYSPQDWNRYAYVANNPLSNIDPTGLFLVVAGAKNLADAEDELKAVQEALIEAGAPEAANALQLEFVDNEVRITSGSINLTMSENGTAALVGSVIESSNAVALKITGASLSRSGGARTKPFSSGDDPNRITVEISPAGIRGTIVRGVVAGGPMDGTVVGLSVSLGTAVIHEFGHAYGYFAEKNPAVPCSGSNQPSRLEVRKYAP